MAKIKLQPDPTFKAKVEIAIPGGAPVGVSFTFKYRTRQEMDRFIESVNDNAFDDDVKMVLAMVVGWELDDTFSEENVRILVDSYISSPVAIFETYCREITGVRRKN
jgi:hypothetical protein